MRQKIKLRLVHRTKMNNKCVEACRCNATFDDLGTVQLRFAPLAS